MMVKYLMRLFCLGMICLHTISYAAASQTSIKENISNVKTTNANNVPATSAAKPTSVSAIDTKQTYVPQKILPYTNIDGNIRLYNFYRDYSRPQIYDQRAFSLGGKLNVTTNLWLKYFRLTGTLYTAQSLGLDPSYPPRQDRSLPAKPLTALGQAFIQFENPYLMARVGDSLINTPWMNPADSRMIPASYRGIYVFFAPWQSFNSEDRNFNFIALRQTGYKSRTSDFFSQHNLYSISSYTTASTFIPALDNKKDIGTLAIGGLLKYKSVYLQAWAYRFYNYSRIYYADIKYNFPKYTFFKPLIGAQILHSPADGNNVIGSVPGLGAVNSTAYGALIGTEIGNGQLLFGWNNIPKRAGGYRNGDIVSPYTSGYVADPLYTTSMTSGLVEKAAGSARKITGTYSFLDHQLAFALTGAQYFTSPYLINTNEIDVDAIYMPIPIFKKSLSVRMRMGFANHTSSGKLIYSRLMMQYEFT